MHIGQVVGTQRGPLEIVERLGSGGMAEVFLAVDRSFAGGERFVAVKTVRLDLLDDPDLRHSFGTECRISLIAASPHLPVAYDAGEFDGRPYLVMEYIHGATLYEISQRLQRMKKKLSAEVVAAIGLSVASALAALHNAKTVQGQSLEAIHRDVSPTNVMIGYDGRVRLIDLGVARSSNQMHRTEAGVVKGKYAYMSPEQLASKAPYDGRSDVFGLGAMLHELLTCRPLFSGGSELETVERVNRMHVPSLDSISELSADFHELIMRCLERDVQKRPNANQVVAALEMMSMRGLVSEVGTLREAMESLGEFKTGTGQRFARGSESGVFAPQRGAAVGPHVAAALAKSLGGASKLRANTTEIATARHREPAREPARRHAATQSPSPERDEALHYFLQAGNVGQTDE